MTRSESIEAVKTLLGFASAISERSDLGHAARELIAYEALTYSSHLLDEAELEDCVYVVETEAGFTELFTRHDIELMERLGLIQHVRDAYVLTDENGNGVGPLHRFYSKPK